MIKPENLRMKWSGDYYGPGLADHMHALGVVAANYNQLELTLYTIFAHYTGRTIQAAALFSQMKNNFRIDTLKCLVQANEPDDTIGKHIFYFADGFNICADNRNFLMHSSVDNIQKGATALPLRKSGRKSPIEFKNIILSAEQIRKIADEIWAFEFYGTDLLFWLAGRDGYADPNDPDIPKTLPERPALPDSLYLLVQKAEQ